MTGNVAPSEATLIRSRYQVLEALGHGGLGTVYYGWDYKLERPVAIKRLVHHPTGNQNLREEAWREARTMAAIQHANIVTLYDFGEDEEGPFFIMEFINGHTLDHLACLEHVPDEDTLVEISRQVLKGLCAAHEKGIIHRDMKASNVMVTQSASGDVDAKILDFGLARFQQAPTEQTVMDDGSFLGSVFYTAPEQLNRGALDERTDLYSLGHVMYHYAAGQTAFNGDSIHQLIAAHLNETPRPLEELRPDLNKAFVQWIEWLIQKAPEHRPESTHKALESLKGITGRIPTQNASMSIPQTSSESETEPVDPIPTAPSKPVFTLSNAPPPQKGFPWFWALVGGTGTIALAAILYFAFFSNDPAPYPAAATSPPEKKSEPSPQNPAENSSRTRGIERAPTTTIRETTTSTSTFGEKIWNPKEIASLGPHLGRRITIQGTPIELGDNRSGTAFYLNFTRNYKDSVAVVMFLSNDPDGFTRENLQPFIGRPIQVTGILDEYRGSYQIKLADLSEIRPL